MEPPGIEQNSKDSANSHPETLLMIQKFSYALDYPAVTHPATLETQNNSVIVSFPRKPSVTVTEYFRTHQTVQVFVNKQLVFDLDWIPIYSFWDFLRVQDLLCKSLIEYTNIVQGQYYVPSYSTLQPTYCSNIATVFETNSFHLYNYETEHVTSINIDIENEIDQQDSNPCRFQICFDNNVNFCTEKLFKNLDVASQHFLVQFMLSKITSKSHL